MDVGGDNGQVVSGRARAVRKARVPMPGGARKTAKGAGPSRNVGTSCSQRDDSSRQ